MFTYLHLSVCVCVYSKEREIYINSHTQRERTRERERKTTEGSGPVGCAPATRAMHIFFARKTRTGAIGTCQERLQAHPTRIDTVRAVDLPRAV